MPPARRRYKEHCSKGLDILDLATDDLTSPWIVAECVIETICRVKCGTYEKKEKAKWLEGILQGRQDVEYDLGEICKDPSIGLQFPRLRTLPWPWVGCGHLLPAV